MKKLFTLLFIVVALFACKKDQKTDGYVLNGNVSGFSETKVLLQQRVEGEFVTVDSAVVTNGAFTLKGKVDAPEMFYIKFAEKKYFPLFVENTTIELKGNMDSLDNLKVTGSPLNEINDKYNAELAAAYAKYDILTAKEQEAAQKKDDAALEAIKNEYKAIDDEVRAIKMKYFNENVKNVFSAYLLLRDLGYEIELKEMQDLVAKFDTTIAKHKYTTKIVERIDVLKKVDIGQIAPDFSQNDPSGKPIALSSFKGKYVLIDFWASWCRPCRAENPNNVAMYKKYNKKGFEIFGVSLDNNKENWEKAIKDDGLTWAHVSDVQGWKNAVAKIYGVNSIPHTVLLDKEGKIIAKNLRGDDLKAKLEELFGK